MSNRTTWGAVMSTSDSLSDIDDDRGHGLRRQALLHDDSAGRGGGGRGGNWAESSSLPSSPPPEGSFTAEVDKSPLASQLAAMRLRLVSFCVSVIITRNTVILVIVSACTIEEMNQRDFRK